MYTVILMLNKCETREERRDHKENRARGRGTKYRREWRGEERRKKRREESGEKRQRRGEWRKKGSNTKRMNKKNRFSTQY